MHCCRKHELGPNQIFGVHGNSHFLVLGMKCLQKQNILQDQPVHGSLNMILLQSLSIFIYQYTSPFERNLGRLNLNSKKMADICLRFTHFINIAYHVIPSSVHVPEEIALVFSFDLMHQYCKAPPPPTPTPTFLPISIQNPLNSQENRKS